MLDNLMGILMSIKVTDIIDITVVAYLMYMLLGFIKKTRAQQLFRGVLLIVAFFLISEIFNLSLLNWLFTRLITVGLIAVVILFQPEIRRGLEQIGRRGVITRQFRDIGKEEIYATVHKLVDAVDDFSATRTGALMAIERETMLSDIAETGVIINAEISVRLLGNLFYEGSPLHDGAVIIRGDRVYAASCVLPLTERQNIGKNLGTRHRAALGLSEVSDAFIIVVSEETGAISVAQNGEFKRFLDLKTLEKMLLDIYIPFGEDRDLLSRLKFLKGGREDD
ncbi:MAG: TIGR00159 family protein [Clostridiales bacterium]|nr:TIGR00159 family protein [Clostridiales bacterium]MBR0469394.1 diadenylate cyclase CdaA [Mogibacterium sp.]